MWGTSYGTYVSAVYAQKYPARTDRVLLDSTDDPDPSRVARGWLANMSAAMDERFGDFAAWAAAPEREKQGLRLAERPEDVRPMVLALARKLDGVPERADGKPLLTGNRLREEMFRALYDDGAFEKLAKLIVSARAAGDTPVVAEPVVLPSADATLSVAVICNDVRWPRSVPSYARAVAEDRARYPLTAGMPVNVTPCAFWKNAPEEKPTRITSEGPSNVLMVQNLRDPATPYRAALKMREALGGRARMVAVDAGGHGAYLSGNKARGSACADRTVSEFLVTGRRPAGDVLCR